VEQKKLLLRTLDSIPKNVDDADPFPFVKRAFETIALAKVATSAEEARTLGFLAEDDTISMNSDRLIADAKKEVLALAASGYVQPQTAYGHSRAGQSRTGDVETGHTSNETRRLYFRSRRIDWRKAGTHSDRRRVNHQTRVSEQYLLDLEREAFLSLAGTRKRRSVWQRC